MIKTIGYVSEANPFEDRRAWSGLRFKIREAIENAGYEVEWVPYKISPWIKFVLKIMLKVCYGLHFEYTRHPIFYWICAKSIDKTKIAKYDALFFPGMAQLASYLNYEKPIIYYVDATHDCLAGYYGSCTNNTRRIGNSTEARAIDRCTLMLHASEWSRQSSIKKFGSNPNKNYVFQFGANIDNKDIVEANAYVEGPLNILFSGVDWERKGAVEAIDTVKELRSKGYDAKLYLCGIKEIPTAYLPLPDYVINCGFLNKNNPVQYKKYIEIIKQSHLFLLPTKAECAGIVFSEASAYGLPIFTYNTGGIGDYVKDGVNGYKLPLGSTGNDFASKIDKSIQNGELKALSDGGKKLFETELSWDAWSKRFHDLIINSKI